MNKKGILNHIKTNIALLCAVGIALGQTAMAGEKSELEVSWKDGIRLNSADKKHKLKFGGRVMVDHAVIDDGIITKKPDDPKNGTEVRRARLYVSGTIYERIVFKTQYDFASSKGVGLKDVYVGLSKIPGLGTITVGNQYEPMGLGENTSSKYITFMERGLISAFTPGRHSGIRQTGNYLDNQLYVSVGVYRPTNQWGSHKGEGQFAATGRITGLLYNKDKNIVHLGASGRFAKINGELKYSERPETHIADKWVSAKMKGVDMAATFGGELAAVFGAVHFSSEYLGSLVQYDAGGKDTYLFAASGQIGYFLTGEKRSFSGKKATFGRTSPKSNAFVDGGYGAWEIAARASHIDLSDPATAVNGDRMNTYTAGLNWYLNPNARVMLNYVRAKVYTVDTANIYQARVQLDF